MTIACPPPDRSMLHGIKVVDLSTVIFGPYCGQVLADLGADVVKVEGPEGDPMRRSGAMRSPQMGAAHLTLNRGKRSLMLDLKGDTGKKALWALLSDADIFLHNVRGPAIERLGFGYQAVRAANPRILYVHCVGYGSNGPYAKLPAYDDVIQAASGAASLLPRVDGNPRPRYLPSTLADKVAGLHAAYATLAALFRRERTGMGQFIEVPMFECFTAFMLEEHLAGGTFSPPIGAPGYQRQLEPHRQPFPTADGHISIVPYGDANWITLFDVLGRPDILDLPDYASSEQRVRNAETLYRWVGDLTPARTTQDWIEMLSAASIPAMPVRDIATICEDPHLAATGFFKPRRHPTEGDYLELRQPVRFGDSPDPEIRPAARLGQHNAEIFRELQMPEDRAADAV